MATKLDRESYDRIIRCIEAADGEPRSYSGRCMYGAECVGVECDPLEFLAALPLAVLDECEDADEAREVLEALTSPRGDSMGRSGILYWPSLVWQGDDEEDEEDGEEVTVNTEDYRGLGNGYPGGDGEWMFSFGERENQPCPDNFTGLPHFSFNGTYARAKKAAVRRAVELGMPTVFVRG